MTKRNYYNLCLMMPRDWLEAAAQQPGQYMRPIHVALMRLALRNRKSW